ncbi:hypothetical protein GCM10010236_79200 [Streptomyces eurythermus]|nr:hypothetical protein GCM10010236_79200 [Streptomyces eurythermus]
METREDRPLAQARARATLPNRPHRTTNDALGLIAHRLRLPSLAPNANDPPPGLPHPHTPYVR